MSGASCARRLTRTRRKRKSTASEASPHPGHALNARSSSLSRKRDAGRLGRLPLADMVRLGPCCGQGGAGGHRPSGHVIPSSSKRGEELVSMPVRGPADQTRSSSSPMAATSRCMSGWAEACSASATIKAVRVCSRTAEWLLCRFVHRRACALPAPPASRSHDRLAAQGSGTRPRPREPTRQQRSCRIARACARDNPGLAPFSA
jgi:hypothetical protein